ncbi:hypothetical protein ETD83_22650 [Actinomadura soli]|uniref:Uncharacterized protein n=1 Tax=Actinomadura soli TaxID=2508997 RepID=A0A5C4J933_9ACTN|nr:hypothetical protein [Actinomadura soli]TMQ95290.1 hypothetical protein ETD83_22650 [Actinomadura soli]
MSEGTTTWIAQTRQAVETATDAVQAQRHMDALQDAARELDEALPLLAKVRKAAELDGSAWWRPPAIDDQVLTFLDAAQQSLQARALSAATRAVRERTAALNNAAQSAWKQYLRDRTGDAHELRELMSALGGATDIAAAAQQLDEALAPLIRLGGRLPTEQDLQLLDQADARFAHLREQLPAGVRDFVSAAARGGAPLDLLDSQVLAWLQDQDVALNFKIVTGAPAGGPHE